MTTNTDAAPTSTDLAAFVAEAAASSSSSSLPLSPSLILYATTQGAAEGVAREVYTKLKAAQPTLPVMLLSTAQLMTPPSNMDALSSIRFLCCVVASTGDGEVPDMANKFTRELRLKGLVSPFLKDTKMSVCALGSSDYSQFCEGGIKVHRLLKKAGATDILPLTKIDEVTMEESLQKWFKTIETKVFTNPEFTTASATATRAVTSSSSSTSSASSIPTTQSDSKSNLSSETVEKKRAEDDAPAMITHTQPAPSASVTTPTVHASVLVTTKSDVAVSGSAPETSVLTVMEADSKPKVTATPATTTTSESKTAASTSTDVATTDTDLAAFVASAALSSLPLSPSLILYATTQGAAEGVAREVYTKLKAAQPTLPVMILSTAQLMTPPSNMDALSSIRFLCCVVASTGDGEVPDMANKFTRELRLKGLVSPFLKDTKMSVCALGSSDYSQFCEGGIKVHRLLKKAGASDILPLTKIDEVTMEESLQKWFKTIETKIFKNAEFATPSATPSASATTTPAPIVNVIPPTETPSVSTTPPETLKSQVTIPTAIFHPLHISSSSPAIAMLSPTSAAATAAAAPVVSSSPPATSSVKAKKSAASAPQLTWLTSSDAPEYDVSHELPIYYTRRWGNLDSTSRSALGTESEAPVFATLHGARFLTTSESHKRGRMVVHMELEVPRGKHAFTYKPGDALGIYVANDRPTVDALLARLQVKEEMMRQQFTHPLQADPKYSHLPSPCTILDAFLYGLDITSPKTWRKSVFVLLAESCTDQAEKIKLLAIAGRDANGKLVKSVAGVRSPYDLEIMAGSPSLLDLLTSYPSCQPPIDRLLLELPALLPRSYSLSSAQVHDAGIMSIAWSKVEWKSEKYGLKEGVATKWMKRLCEMAGFISGEETPAASATSTALSPPQSPSSSSSILGALRQNKDGKYQIPVFRKHSSYFALPEDSLLGVPANGVAASDAASSLAVSSGMIRPQSVPASLSSLVSSLHFDSLHSSSSESRIRRPLIMIGPGTGVAPFRGFLQARLAKKLALECTSGCEGEWRTMDTLARPSKKSSAGGGAGSRERSPCASDSSASLLKPPMSNAEGTLTLKGKAKIAETPKKKVPPPQAAPTQRRALGHYDTPDIVFDDEYDDGRFGGGAGGVSGGSSSTTLQRSESPSSAEPTIGQMYLYFGCRRSDWDYLYASDFAEFVEQEVLTQFSVAFSREETAAASSTGVTSDKYYVQHRLLSHGAQIADLLLHHQAYLYVCGDGVRMAADVTSCIRTILHLHGGMTQQEAEAKIQQWKSRQQGKEPTYVEDIWS